MSQAKAHTTRGFTAGEASNASTPVCSQLPERTGYQLSGSPMQTISEEKKATAKTFISLAYHSDNKKL